MSEYRVDPDGVLGVLAGLDDLGAEFESAHTEIDRAATDGPSQLTVDGRNVLSKAWTSFLEDRRLVPGKVMHVVNVSAQAVSEATVVIVSGDEQIATDTASAQSHAETAWGIPPQEAYVTFGVAP